MKVDLIKLFTGDLYFEVVSNKSVCSTSNNITNLFNLDVDKYNDLLINEVIKHSNYTISKYNKDLSFIHDNVSKETYVKRFKEAFAPQLTLLSF